MMKSTARKEATIIVERWPAEEARIILAIKDKPNRCIR